MFDRLFWIGRLIRHRDKLDDIEEAIDEFGGATTLLGKYDAAYKVGRPFVEVYEDLTVQSTFANEAEALAHVQGFGDGAFWSRLVNIADKLANSPALRLILETWLAGKL